MAWEQFKSFDVRVWTWPPNERAVVHAVTAVFFLVMGIWAYVVDRDVEYAMFCAAAVVVGLVAVVLARNAARRAA